MPTWNPKSKKESLEYLYPALAKEWHPDKNQISPRDIKPNACKPVWWICPNGHEYLSWVYYRTVRGWGCPFCSGRIFWKENCLKTVNPGLAQEWHPTKNKPLTPNQVWPNSHKKVWWVCSRGHEWEARISNRNYGSKCPFCNKSRSRASEENCLATIYPGLAEEWHPTKNGNLTPKDVAPKSNKKVWWKCPMGHEWETLIVRRTTGSRCPICRLSIPSLESCLLTAHLLLSKG